MGYTVRCQCGTAVAVAAVEAGATKRCACGLSLVVPSLQRLRLDAGEPPTRSPELVIPALLKSGGLPWGDECCECGTPTAGVIYLRANCESVQRTGRDHNAGDWVGWEVAALFFRLFIGLVVALRPKRVESRETGKDVRFVLPLRACAHCPPTMSAGKFKAAMTRVPVYAQLLEKYPSAEVTFMGTACVP